MTTYTAPRPNSPYLDWLATSGLMPFGAEGGILSEGDIVPRVTQTADQVDLNVIWEEMQQVLGQWNAHRSAVVDLLSYWHTSSADAVPQALIESEYEEASEYGEPESMGPPSESLLLGYTFKDYWRVPVSESTRF
ncbi:hypothetical protein [Mycolicibacterium brisbanense]|uniref:Uncharacterized protein n=1 Tax=Mycolicibacterium brisbanense TaxID=146020 RepID=A0A100VVS4_9MYCO|nr:hypothetical protein [Mycolicibacterium brisbanense]MCV7159625.1 hypothetical protein [Mycolicibacterium brisbanense]GAS86949.1 uncharacterized protein RMCB_1045 [Mycolicibacterium brisbanense]